MLLSLVIKTNPTAEKCTYRVKCYNFAPSNARLRGKILFIELKVQNYWPFILPNIYKFHHPGSGRKQTIPFPKGRQPTESDVLKVRELLIEKPLIKSELIEYLHIIQDQYGHLSSENMAALAELLGLSLAEVYEVATFYAHFDVLIDNADIPPNEIAVRICNSLPCALSGSNKLLENLETDSLNGARIIPSPCMGRCDVSPVAEIGHHYVDYATTESIKKAVDDNNTDPELPDYPDLSSFKKNGGYKIYEACISGKLSCDEAEDIILSSGLKGMGGAGFPSAQKWAFVRKESKPRLLAVNADEGEPGTFKDRYFLEKAPHEVLEGALIAAWVIDADEIYIYLRDEYPAARKILLKELLALENAGIINPGKIKLRRGAGAYICGEESAMIESIEGKRGIPRHRPPYVAQVGLFQRPTLVHNVETLYWIRKLLESHQDSSKSDTKSLSANLRAYSISGRVREPGVKIAPIGITARDLINNYAGGMAEGHNFKAYLPGGASGGILPASLADIPMDFGTLEKYGCFVGSAAVIVLSDQDSAREAAVNLMRFFEKESCGQCTPCRVGTEKAVNLMLAEKWDEKLLEDLSKVMREASICGLGQAAPNPMDSILKYFPEEIQ
ncbi:MAG: NADH-quinone oxidoreductase subunit F [Rhodospirillaceae bacterium]|nr:NADH-quinone oxidoreductase subunit F [Rhodospirillaceae bacterium]